MPKFRMNHSRQTRGGILNPRTFILLVLLALIIIWQFPDFLDRFLAFEQVLNGEEVPEIQVEDYEQEELYFLPKSSNKNVVRHKYYALAYNERHEVADWVAYELTKEQLQKNNVKREDNFREDPKIKSQTANVYDYRGSGYDRGHLLPVADRNFSFEAMDETFFFSNIAPQVRQFNGGIWRELEELVRDWAYKYRKVYVVTGPVLNEPPLERIGKNRVSVPAAFYKVILDISKPEYKGIGFIIPNETSEKPLATYATTIDEVEAITGIDFFPNLVEDELEQKIEAEFDNSLWVYSQRKYETRLEKWNKR